MRGPQARKSGNKIDPLRVIHLPGQRLYVGRGTDDSQAVPQPLDHGSPNENAAFERIGRFSIDFPGNGCDQIIRRENGIRPGVHQHEASRSVGVFHHSRRGTHLPEQGSLLISGSPAYGDRNRKGRTVRFPVYFAGAFDFRENLSGHLQEVQKFVVPLPGVDVIEHGP